MTLHFKEKVYNHYLSELTVKIKSLQDKLNELSESAKNETKSTAGDKHETALAMLQIEQEKIRSQHKEALEQKVQLERINIQQSRVNIAKGSLIQTNKGYFFLSIALGKSIIDNLTVFAISPQSPLGEKLTGLSVNDVAEIKGINYLVEAFL
ncbi:MAG: hypothetical protein RL222_500 [Bacteroidota bacterium]|jgi:hypothetical protein